jgi:hypothetical protein
LNFPVKRFEVETIAESQSFLEKLFRKKENISEVNLKCLETKKGINMDLLRRMAVSENGDFVWGNHLSEFPKGRVLRQCFSTGESLLYDYEHENIVLSVLVVEDLQTVISGGLDKKAILHDLDSGKTNKIIDLKYGYLTCLYRLGNVVAVGDEDRVRFFDLVNRKHMDVPHIEFKGSANCMLIREGKSKENNVELLVGNYSPELKQITLVDKIIKAERVIRNIKAPAEEKENKNMKKIVQEKQTYEELVVKIEFLIEKNQLLKHQNQLLEHKNQLLENKNQLLENNFQSLENNFQSFEHQNQLLKDQNDLLVSKLSELKTKTIGNFEMKHADLEKELKFAKSRKKEYKREFKNVQQELDQEKRKNTKLIKVRMNKK